MNDQKGRELPFSVRQVVPGQLSYRQLSPGQLSYPRAGRSLRGFMKGISLLVIVSLLLVLILELVIHLNHQGQQPIHTMQATFSSQDAFITSQINNLLMNKATHQQFSGSVLIAHNDQVLLRKGYSMADWSKQVPNTPQTRFYLGSTTKQFTAMAILILQEQSKLHVHDHICSYFAPCPQPWQQVTIHELLTHTSGIPEYDHTSLSNASPQSWINDFDDVPLGFAPSVEFSYCNVCYQILGYVVEKVSGEPYCTFLFAHLTYKSMSKTREYAFMKMVRYVVHSIPQGDWTTPLITERVTPLLESSRVMPVVGSTP